MASNWITTLAGYGIGTSAGALSNRFKMNRAAMITGIGRWELSPTPAGTVFWGGIYRLPTSGMNNSVPVVTTQIIAQGGGYSGWNYGQLSSPLRVEKDEEFLVVVSNNAGINRVTCSSASNFAHTDIADYFHGYAILATDVAQNATINWQYLQTAPACPASFLYEEIPPPSGEPWVKTWTPGSVGAENSNTIVGLHFTVGPEDLEVHALGRVVWGGNSGTRTLGIYSDLALNSLMGSVTVDLTGQAANTTVWGDLPVPLRLIRGHRYILGITEISGQNRAACWNSPATFSSVATNSGYSTSVNGANFTAPDTSYLNNSCPVNFRYTIYEEPPLEIEVTIDPATATVASGGTKQFQATVENAVNTAVTWTVANSPAHGTISSTGLYQAPVTSVAIHNVTITARSVEDPTKFATAIVDVTAAIEPPPAGGERQAVAATLTLINN